jgi:glutamine---fructose-6-phosphate transaminase (isomerizing)
MCGVFGITIAPGAELQSDVRAMLRRLYRLSESRGKEAAGLATVQQGRLTVTKAYLRGARFIRTPETQQHLADLFSATPHSGQRIAVGHTRMVTNGDPADNANNQPVGGGRVAVVHNGIIINDAAIWDEEPDLVRRFGVDTEVFVRLVERGLERSGTLSDAFVAAAERVAGANTFAMLDPVTESLLLATTNGSLYLATSPCGGTTVFASEEAILERVLARQRFRRRSRGWAVEQLSPGTWLDVTSEPRRRGMMAAHHVVPSQHASRRDRQGMPSSIRDLERVLAIDADRIGALRRCTRCIMPETFPGIRFDGDGVCSICHAHRPQVHRSLEELVDGVGPGGRVLVPLSGGRDSSYALHHLTKELGLRTVAYTYDWGMVTDLARRNISRMCGALGVEHILISADIRRKRQHIRQNIHAWLRRPHLGTVPLFMAGDKHFFYYAQVLRRQMKLQSVVFSMNPLERTDFKAGFAGVGERGPRAGRHYDLKGRGKARIAAFYAAETVRNPAFINASLIDSVAGYLSYYAIPKRFESLFDFVPWREDEVDDVLLGTYDWETSPDSSSTWRIGDGTAPFYNYLYLRIAGFTENDALRSNQIREGHLLRERALQLAQADNRLRAPSLAWYFDTVGIDGPEVIRTVNRVPALYA